MLVIDFESGLHSLFQLKAIVMIFGIPIVAVVLWFTNQQNVALLLTLVYIIWAYGEMAYDQRTISSIKIPQAASEISEFLKTTDSKGSLIYANLLSSYKTDDERISQSELVRRAQQKGTRLTAQQIRTHILNLKSRNLISGTRKYKYSYQLTDEGKWCRIAITQCFPRRRLLFYLRNRLGMMMKIPPYPKGP